MRTTLVSFLRDESAAQMVEYALLIMLIALVAFLGVRTFGESVRDLFKPVNGTV